MILPLHEGEQRVPLTTGTKKSSKLMIVLAVGLLALLGTAGYYGINYLPGFNNEAASANEAIKNPTISRAALNNRKGPNSRLKAPSIGDGLKSENDGNIVTDENEGSFNNKRDSSNLLNKVKQRQGDKHETKKDIRREAKELRKRRFEQEAIKQGKTLETPGDTKSKLWGERNNDSRDTNSKEAREMRRLEKKARYDEKRAAQKIQTRAGGPPLKPDLRAAEDLKLPNENSNSNNIDVEYQKNLMNEREEASRIRNIELQKQIRDAQGNSGADDDDDSNGDDDDDDSKGNDDDEKPSKKDRKKNLSDGKDDDDSEDDDDTFEEET